MPRMPNASAPVHVVGGGLAGSECAYQLASRGVPVVLHEMRPVRPTPAHKSGDFAELVCSNSLRSDDPEHVAGFLKREMERFGSLIIGTARTAAVPAGSALAVDRDRFAAAVSARLEELVGRGLLEIRREEVTDLGALTAAHRLGGIVWTPIIQQAHPERPILVGHRSPSRRSSMASRST